MAKLSVQSVIEILKEGSQMANDAYDSEEGDRLVAVVDWVNDHEEVMAAIQAMFSDLDSARFQWNVAMLKLQNKLKMVTAFETCENECDSCVLKDDCPKRYGDDDDSSDGGDDDDGGDVDDTPLSPMDKEMLTKVINDMFKQGESSV